MFNSKWEEHQVHGFVCGHVVIVELLLNCKLKFLGVENLLVEFFGADWRHDVSPEQASDFLECLNFAVFFAVNLLVQVFEDFVEVQTPWSVDAAFRNLEQTQPVFFVDQTVWKHS